MTNDRAAEIMKAIIFIIPHEYYSDEVEEAIHMGINALQAQDLNKQVTGKLNSADDTISRAAAIDALDKEYRCTDQSDDWDGLKTAMLIIENLPSAQPEIIRCKECKFYRCDGCFFSTAETIEDGFCSWAERRTDE